MLFSLLPLLAEDPPPAPEGGGSPFGGFGSFLPFIPIIILFYFLLIRPMRRQEAQRQALVSNLKKNDKVLTAAGIYGTVVSVSEKEDEVVLKLDEGFKVKMTKASIIRNLSGEEAAKATGQQPAASSTAITTNPEQKG